MSTTERPLGYPTTSRVEPRLGPLLALLVAGGLLALLNTTVTGVAIPDVAADLDVPLGSVQWVGTAYVLAVAVAIPVSGWASIRFGTRAPWLAALVLFGVGAAASAAAWSLPALVVARAIQGFGGGMLEPLMLTTVATLAGPARMGRIMGVVSGAIGIGPLLGPLLGGVAVDAVGWRGLFVAFVVASAAVLAVSWRALPAGSPLDHDLRLDRRGLALLSVGSVAVLVGLAETSEGGGALAVVGPIVLGLVVLAVFARHAARRAGGAVVDVAVLRNPTVLSATLVMLTLGLAIYPLFYGLPQFFQGVRGYGVLASGLLLAPQGAGSLVGMVLGGRLSDRVSARVLVPSGAAAVVAGMAVYLVVGPTAPIAVLVAASVVAGLGVGFVGGPTMSSLYRVLNPREIPNATTTLFVANQLGGAVGIAVLTGLVTATGGVHAAGWTAASGGTPFWLPVFAGVAIAVGGLRLPRAAAPSSDAVPGAQ